MHSLKNTVVAILLLGVSYGVYQVITTPEPLTKADQDLIGPLEIDDCEPRSGHRGSDPYNRLGRSIR